MNEQHMQAGELTVSLVGHLEGARRDMSQVQALLREAVDNLLADTFAIREAWGRQRETRDAGAAWTELSRDIEARLDASLRHLQFQDMVSQLIDPVHVNLEAAEALVCARDSEGEGHPARMPSPRSKPVTTHEMRAGEIDLF